MKRSMQFQRTDRDIQNAFLELLDEKPFEKITVADILSAALINRSTFYEHYEDKYALLEHIQKKTLDELMELMENISSQNLKDLDIIDSIMNSYFKKNKSLVLKLLNIKTAHVDLHMSFEHYLKDYFSERYPRLSDLELHMFANMFISFFTYYLEKSSPKESYSTLMFESFFNIFLSLMKIEPEDEVRNEVLGVLKNYQV